MLLLANVTWSDVYILALNLGVLYIGYRSLKLLVRASDCVFEEKIRNKLIHNKKETNIEDNKEK